MRSVSLRHLGRLAVWLPLLLLGDGSPVAPSTPPPPKPEACGHCYDNTLKVLVYAGIEGPIGDLYRRRFAVVGIDPTEAMLVHGIATHRREEFRFGHAWIEGNGIVIDLTKSHERPDWIGPKAEYYRMGRIVEAECRRYSLAEIEQHVQAHGHAGPWQPLPDSVHLGPRGPGRYDGP